MTSVRTVILVLFCAASAAAADFERVREMKDHARKRPSVAPHAQAAPKTITVDCAKGEKIQDAVDKNAAPLDILVKGICVESVRIDDKNFTLRGTDPLTDGIQGGSPAGLTVNDVDSAVVQNLAFTGNANGIIVRSDTLFVGENLTISSNTQRGILADDARFASCIGCRLQNNGGFAGVSTRGGILTLLDSVVSGTRGVLAQNGAYADIDCISQGSGNPCSMQVTQSAARASLSGAVAALWGAGSFTGAVRAEEGGHVELVGAQQTSTSNNVVDTLGQLIAGPSFDLDGNFLADSQLRGTTHVLGFSRALIRDGTTLDGSIQCQSAGDAWLDATVVKTAGSTVTGCEHASYP